MRGTLPVLAALLAASPAAAQDQREVFVAGNWRGTAHHLSSGALRHCAMRATYRSGTTLSFAITRDGRFRIGFSNPEWALSADDRHDLTLYIDRRKVFEGTARVMAGAKRKLVQLELPSSARLIGRFRSGHVLHVDAPRGRMGFSLAGTAVALYRLVRCVADRIEKERRRASDNPFAAPDGRDATRSASAGRRETADRVRAVTLIANLLSRVGVGEYEIVPLDDIPERWRGFHALWRAGETLGLVRLYRDADARTRRAIHAAVASHDFDACKGAYQSGVKRAEGPGRPIIFFSRCAGDEAWSIYYTVIGPDRDGRTYLVGLFSPDRNEPIALGEKLRGALTAIVLGAADPPDSEPKREIQ